MWELTNRQATPTEVAQRFVAESWPGSRQILGGKVSGQWVGQRFEGYFHLVDGTRTYLIECDDKGRWTVRIEGMAK